MLAGGSWSKGRFIRICKMNFIKLDSDFLSTQSAKFLGMRVLRLTNCICLRSVIDSSLPLQLSFALT